MGGFCATADPSSHRWLLSLPLRGSENRKVEARHPKYVLKGASRSWKAAEKGCLGGPSPAVPQGPEVGLAPACWGPGGG